MNMMEIEKNRILKKYEEELEKTTYFLTKELSDLNISSIVVYGSATYPNMFVEGVSDIDIIAYANNMKKLSSKKIIDYLRKKI